MRKMKSGRVQKRTQKETRPIPTLTKTKTKKRKKRKRQAQAMKRMKMKRSARIGKKQRTKPKIKKARVHRFLVRLYSRESMHPRSKNQGTKKRTKQKTRKPRKRKRKKRK